jgi:CheY-like chemotaxis protein
MSDSNLDGRASWQRKFHDLMPQRVREVLLVSSPYDAFILEQDGSLTERLFTRYSELNLSSAPRITHAASAKKAMHLLATRRIDLVITMVRLADMDVNAFGRQVKAFDASMPVVLLAFNEAEVRQFPGQIETQAVDRVFLWTGDTRILLAIIKLVEDQLNADHDTTQAGVRVIIVIEDSIRRYSSFLSLLYEELMTQSHSLIEEGLNDLHKLMRMRARPKILLACDFEEAHRAFEHYRDYVQAVISDVRFPKQGREQAAAGFDFVKLVRENDPDIPILLQSSEVENETRARALGVAFADKNAEHFFALVRRFMQNSLGFGDFIFRLPDNTEVGRARNMYEMEQVLHTIPAESLYYHASRHHFSQWLMARSMFDLAQQLRKHVVSEFDDREELRAHLIQVIGQTRQKEQVGVITDFSAGKSVATSRFVRIGSGSIGGKARGVAFANLMLARRDMERLFASMEIRIPKTVAISISEFERFLSLNPQLEQVQQHQSDAQILRWFLDGTLPQKLVSEIEIATREMRGPLAVRSSSLLEDSHFQPFAGIYATYMLPNNHPSKEVRLWELLHAVKAVYASTFFKDSRAYIADTPFSIEEEKMGVLIQEMVGQSQNDRFYPMLSGIALSHNYYPVGHQKTEDGVALIALGLGHMIVMGGSALQFSPAHPDIIFQYGSAKDFMKYSQTSFYALDMNRSVVDFLSGADASLEEYPLSAAEQDGVLQLIASVYVMAEDRIRDNLNASGPRVLTFNNILKWKSLPLPEALSALLDLFRDAMGCAVEIEFALDRGDFGRSAPPGKKRRSPRLYVLQVRPQAQLLLQQSVNTEGFARSRLLCHTDRALGHGVIKDIRHIIYVKQQGLDAFTTPIAASEVSKINEKLKHAQIGCLLIGPGRWGTTDPRLGIPVQWSDISSAKVMVETKFKDRPIEPSQGSHFFHNITSFQIGYLTLGLGRSPDEKDATYLDRAWLENTAAVEEHRFVRHIELKKPLQVLLDGNHGRAAVLKPPA